MKKFLVLSLAVLTFGFVVLPTETRAAENSTTTLTANSPKGQINVQIGNNRRRNRRVVRTTRVSRNGRRVVTRTYRSNGRRTVIRQRVIRRSNRRY